MCGQGQRGCQVYKGKEKGEEEVEWTCGGKRRRKCTEGR